MSDKPNQIKENNLCDQNNLGIFNPLEFSFGRNQSCILQGFNTSTVIQNSNRSTSPNITSNQNRGRDSSPTFTNFQNQNKSTVFSKENSINSQPSKQQSNSENTLKRDCSPLGNIKVENNITSSSNVRSVSPNSSNSSSNTLNMQILYKANNLYKVATNLSSQYCHTEAYDKFYEAKRLTLSVYDNLKSDLRTKNQMDYFLKALESQILNTEINMRNQFKVQQKPQEATDFSNELRKVFNKKEDIKATSNVTVEVQKTQQKSDKTLSSSNNLNQPQSKPQSQVSNKYNVPDDLREKILSEIIDDKPQITFSEVIGLDLAKQTLKEIIILPSLRPDLFTGLRSPPKGLLLFGPPGTGKTMLAKAVATECKCTFFSISASSLTSKYVGESEKLVKALFEIAFEKQPSVIFIDEIDSILSKRSDNENEASKRLKTEFLVQFDGVGSHSSGKVLIIGATNRPMELDSAVIRRLPKRIYVGAFNLEERALFLREIMKSQEHQLNDQDYQDIAKKTDFYSNSDLKELCREAAYGPIRDIEMSNLLLIDKLRPILLKDFTNALKKVRGILNEKMLEELVNWDKDYGALN